MKSVMRIGTAIVAVLLIISAGYYCAGRLEKEYRAEEFLMDTLISVRLFGNDAAVLEEAAGKMFAEMRRVAGLTDRFLPSSSSACQTSDVCRINREAGNNPVRVSEDVFNLLEMARTYYDLSDGAFDVTIGPLMDVWGFGKGEQSGAPAPTEIEEARSLVNSDDLLLDKKERTVYLAKKGMVLDLGAIAKGYAAERALEILKEYGIKRAVLDAGGNICVVGGKKEGVPWKIGIRDPRDPAALIGAVALTDGCAVTSGDYNRYFEVDGKRYHHIISPQTGYPAAENISVTVIGSDSARADALSTVLFIKKPHDALDLAEQLEDTEAVIITAGKEVLVTAGLKGKIELYPGKEYSYDESR